MRPSLRIARLGFLASAALSLAAAPVKLELFGVDASASPVRVVLVDPATREQAWVPVGGRFAGCEVRAYDTRRHMLTLARGAESWEIPLEGARAAAPSLGAEETERISKQVQNNLRQIAAASDQYFLEYGATTVRLDQLIGSEPTKYIKAIAPADGEDYSKLDLTQRSATSKSWEWTIKTERGVVVRYERP